jgi:toxin CcdB
MAQFDVYINPSKATRKQYPYLLDIQSEYLDELTTRIVIPLADATLFKNSAMKILTPEVSFKDEQLLILTPQISSMSRKLLADPIGSLSHLREDIINALDFALLGM